MQIYIAAGIFEKWEHKNTKKLKYKDNKILSIAAF